MKNIFLTLLLLVVTSCVGIPKDALKLVGDSLERREMQSRRFETNDERKILNAAVATMQDMSFKIEASEKELGVIVGSKNASAYNAGEIAAAVVVAALTGVVSPVSKSQTIKASLITSKASNKKGYIARITFQRIVYDTQDRVSRLESVEDKELYKGFFEKLSKSLFLEANEI